MAENVNTGTRRTSAIRLVAGLALMVSVGAIGASSAQQPPVRSPPKPLTPQEWADALKIVRQIALDTGRPAEQRANAVMAYARMQLARNQPAEATKTCWAVFDNPKDQAVAVAAARAACLVTRNTGGYLWGQRRLLDEWAKKARGPASKQALARVRNDQARVTGHLMGLARKRPAPPPIRRMMPHWGRPAAKSGPGVFRFRSPQVAAPGWLKMQPGQGLRMFQVPVPVIKPDPCIAKDKAGVPKALRLALPVYTPPGLMTRDKAGCPRALVLTLPEYVPPPWYKRVQFPPLKETKK